jgi:hypothetical protein
MMMLIVFIYTEPNIYDYVYVLYDIDILCIYIMCMSMSYYYVSFNRLHWPKGEKTFAKLEQTAPLTSDLGYTLW